MHTIRNFNVDEEDEYSEVVYDNNAGTLRTIKTGLSLDEAVAICNKLNGGFSIALGAMSDMALASLLLEIAEKVKQS